MVSVVISVVRPVPVPVLEIILYLTSTSEKGNNIASESLAKMRHTPDLSGLPQRRRRGVKCLCNDNALTNQLTSPEHTTSAPERSPRASPPIPSSTKCLSGDDSSKTSPERNEGGYERHYYCKFL